MILSQHEQGVLSGTTGTGGERMAMEIVVEAARMMGADRLVPIVSGHIDGCLYHGDAGVLFCEKLAEEGARVAVPATTNVGSLNLLDADLRALPEAGAPRSGRARRLGRIECGRLRQHGPRCAHEPLRGLPGPRLRDRGAGALLRATPPGEPHGAARGRRFRATGAVVRKYQNPVRQANWRKAGGESPPERRSNHPRFSASRASVLARGQAKRR